MENVLIRPRITEKASLLAENNVYAFEVTKDATAAAVKQSVKAMYKVTPIDVRFVKIPSKSVFSRGKMGTKKGGRKAYVILKKGDKIEFV